MKKNKFAALTALLLLPFMMMQSVSAMEGAEPLQLCFLDEGKTLEIFTSEDLEDDAKILIGGDTFDAEVKNDGINVNTLFLVDNSQSVSTEMRANLKEAILNYVSDMPDYENVKIASFDTELKLLSDKYTNDREFIEYELSKVDFKGESSAIYNALLEASKSFEYDKEEYFRIVLMSDGYARKDNISFEYLKTEINEKSICHIDAVQIIQNDGVVNKLNDIANWGSNTFNEFDGKNNLSFLKPGNVSMIKAKLPSSITTGEIKGVTIKNGSSDISLGSVMFPHVNGNGASESGSNINWVIIIVLIVVAALLVVGGAVTIIFFCVKKKKRYCSVNVQITKEDARDTKGVGMDVWKFPVSGEFRVGRTLNPVSNNGKPLPTNNKAIFEDATDEDISSIGRNAFSMSYDSKRNSIVVKNIANSAAFYVETSGRKDCIESGKATFVINGSKILLGNYTTIIITGFSVE